MRRVWLLAVNDLRLTVRDRPAFIWMIIMPVAMMWFFGNMGGGGAASDPKISLSVVNRDAGWLSTALIEELADESIDMKEIEPAEDETSRVRTLIIPEGFTAGVLSGDQQELQLAKEPGSNEQFGVAAEVHIIRAIVRCCPRCWWAAPFADFPFARASGWRAASRKASALSRWQPSRRRGCGGPKPVGRSLACWRSSALRVESLLSRPRTRSARRYRRDAVAG